MWQRQTKVYLLIEVSRRKFPVVGCSWAAFNRKQTCVNHWLRCGILCCWGFLIDFNQTILCYFCYCFFRYSKVTGIEAVTLQVLKPFWGMNFQVHSLGALWTPSVLCASLAVIVNLLCVLKCLCGLGQSLHCLGNGTICALEKMEGKLVVGNNRSRIREQPLKFWGEKDRWRWKSGAVICNLFEPTNTFLKIT